VLHSCRWYVNCSSKSLSRRHTVSGSRSSGNAGSLSVHSWFAASSLLTKCIWSTAVAQHQFYIDVTHTVSLVSAYLVVLLSVVLTLYWKTLTNCLSTDSEWLQSAALLLLPTEYRIFRTTCRIFRIQWAERCPKCAPSSGGLGPHLYMISWAHPSPYPKQPF